MPIVDYIIEKLLVNPVHNTSAPPPPVGSSSGGGPAGKAGATTANNNNNAANRTSKLSSFLHPTILRGTNINSVSPSTGGGAAHSNGNGNNSNSNTTTNGGAAGAANSAAFNRGNPAAQQLTEEEVVYLVIESRKLFMSQPMLVEIEAPVRLCGDVHGQYNDLLRLFELGGYPPESNYMFLGDYVDRGLQSLETVCLLLAYKLKYPDTFFMLRGNHESSSINRIYGFFDECKRRYSVKLWKQFTDTFNCMPVAGLVSLRVLCMHGGLSPELQDLDQIRHILRPTDVPDSGLICDLLWSDPEDGVKGWGENDRGVSWTFGANVVDEITAKFDIDLICRAHQVVDDGYQFFANRKGVTVFSAPNYCGEFDNAGAFLCVDENLLCSIIRIEPTYSAYGFY